MCIRARFPFLLLLSMIALSASACSHPKSARQSDPGRPPETPCQSCFCWQERGLIAQDVTSEKVVSATITMDAYDVRIKAGDSNTYPLEFEPASDGRSCEKSGLAKKGCVVKTAWAKDRRCAAMEWRPSATEATYKTIDMEKEKMNRP